MTYFMEDYLYFIMLVLLRVYSILVIILGWVGNSLKKLFLAEKYVIFG